MKLLFKLNPTALAQSTSRSNPGLSIFVLLQLAGAVTKGYNLITFHVFMAAIT